VKWIAFVGTCAPILPLARLVLGFSPVLACAVGPFPPPDVLLPRASLCVTEGSLAELEDRRMSIEESKVRAYVNQATTDAVELRFTYLA